MESIILSKIKNKKILHITNGDKEYIYDNVDFCIKIMDLYGSKEEYWNVFFILFEEIVKNIYDYDREKVKTEVLHNYLKETLKTKRPTFFSTYVYGAIDVTLDYFPDDKACRSIASDLICTALEKQDNLDELSYTSHLINFLISKHKIDVINKIKNINDFPGNYIRTYFSTYVNDKNNPPKFYDCDNFIFQLIYSPDEFMYVVDKIEIENLSIKFITNVFSEYCGALFGIDQSYRNNLLEELLRRIMLSNEDADYVINKRMNAFLYNNIRFYLEDNPDLLIKLINSKVYYFSSMAIENKIKTEEEIFYEVLANINDENAVNSFISLLRVSRDIKEIVAKNSKLMNVLIKMGKLNILLDIITNHTSFYQKSYYVHEIVEEIATGNSCYDEDIKNLSNYIFNYFKILDAILKTGKLTNFTFLNNYRFQENYRSVHMKSVLYLYMGNCKKQIILPENIDFQDFEIINILISNNLDRELFIWLKNILVRNRSIGINISDIDFEYIVNVLKAKPEYFSILSDANVSIKFAFLNTKTLRYCLELEGFNKLKLIEYANHHEELSANIFFYTKENCLLLKDFILAAYSFKEENYLYLVNTLGPYVLKYLENSNIRTLLVMDFSILQKICNLFLQTEFNMRDVESVYDAIKQYEFTKKYPEVINIYPDILHNLNQVNNFEGNQITNSAIAELPFYLDEKFTTNLLKKHSFPNDVKTNFEIVAFVMNKIKNNEDSTKYRAILHSITNYFIRKKREEYRSSYNMYDELEMKYTYNQESLINNLFNYLVSVNPILSINHSFIPFSEHLVEYAEKQEFDGDIESLFKRKKISKYVKNFAIKFIIEKFDQIDKHIILLVKRNYSVKRDYILSDKLDISYVVLSTLLLNQFINNVINDEKIYQSLLHTMQKRKLHAFPKFLTKFIKKVDDDLAFGIYDLSSFINYYHSIYRNECKLRNAIGNQFNCAEMSLINIIKSSKAYNYNLDYYKLILGDKDAILLKENKGPNAATRKLYNNERLEEAINWTIHNFKRNEVTIPTFNEIFEINDKRMRVIVGNFTHPSNLTHGERTGACMRIGGVGESLFRFVLKNKNGFHIRFEDPESHEYISRVSGFRNGNTVFLNELRYSLNKDRFSNEDVVEFCKLASQRLIDYSKSSSCPIENVVIHSAYAVSRNAKQHNLNVTNIKRGLPDFYSDVSNYVVILATTEKNGTFAPVRLNLPNLPVYKPARETVRYTEDLDNFKEFVNRIHAIRILLKSNVREYEIDVLHFDDGFLRGYVGEDWYAYLDSVGKVHFEIINNRNGAEVELSEAISNLKQKRLVLV